MVKTRRSSNVSSPPLLDPKRRRELIEETSPDTRAIQQRLTRKEVCFKLLRELFCRSARHYWFKILPTEDGDDDITICTGLDWSYLLPLLIFCGLVVFRVDSVVKEGQVVIEQWEEFRIAMSKDVRLELTTVRKRSNERIHYFCLGRPEYNNPMKQTNILFEGDNEQQSSLRLRIDLKAQSRTLLKHRHYLRVVQGSKENSNSELTSTDVDDINNNSSAFDDEINQVTEEVDRTIIAAEELNLLKRPRLSRTNASKFSSCRYILF